jgi:drug/metabolite transporter superfamily protein YnfA
MECVIAHCFLRENKGAVLGLLGGLTLTVYRIIQILQPACFGRVYAAYKKFLLFLPLSGGFCREEETRQVLSYRNIACTCGCFRNVLFPR